MNSLELFAAVLAWTWIVGWIVVSAVFIVIGKLTNNMPKFKLAPWFTITSFIAVSFIIYNFIK